ncbi:MAG: glycosyltransferase, partial [Caldilinea sp.]|nr:glycosyltransferase [Caldilinea sp.]MDW8438877.1 glycosyltransferase [Caldilineaceae bacterium]
MNVLLVTIGTHGDVQPYIALAYGLQSAGCTVVLCTHATHRNFVERYGVAFAPLAGDIRALLAGDDGRKLLTQRNPLAAVRRLHLLAAPLLRQVMLDIIEAAQGADLILASTLAYPNAVTAGHVHHIPLMLAGLQPITPTSAFPCPLLPPLSRSFPGSGAYHRLSHHAAFRLLQFTSARLVNRHRRELTGLPALRYADVFGDLIAQRTPVIYGFSEHLLPRPADYGSSVHLTGFWFLETTNGWEPSPALEAFLANGPPPVYVGFGSMSDRKPEETAQIVVEALRRSGQRGILAAGWQGLRVDRRHPDIHSIDHAPHAWLFPQVALTVHHAGVGTVAAALRAGVPQALVPFGADQPLWAEMAYRRGVAPRPIPRSRLTPDNLSAAIAQALRA